MRFRQDGREETARARGEATRQDGTCLHATGTCRMGDFEDAVLDARLRVKEGEGLRVMDCSVLAKQVSGKPNGVAMGMAWRASEIILKDRQTGTFRPH